MVSGIAFLLPNFLGFAVFTAWPVLYSLGKSFTNWNLQKTIPYSLVGTHNYLALVHDPQFWIYFANTFYMMLGIPVSIFGSLFLAILLSQKLKGMTVYRTLFYLPAFTSGVALMILWKNLYNPTFGPVNSCLDWCISTFHVNEMLQALHLGTVSPPAWLSSMKNLLGLDVEQVRMVHSQWGLGAKDAINIMGIWTAIGGSNMLLYIAAISNVPQELYEASQVDGAGRWAIFRNVTWPQLAPTTFFIVIMSFIGGLQGGFEQARVMTEGGPAGTTTTLSYYIYSKAFQDLQMGYASAISWVLFAMIFIVTMINWKIGSKEVNY
jgi:multiple sugar transport system permease protein